MKYHLVALFTVFVWGFTFVSTKVLLADFSPLWILMTRFVMGFVALCVLRPHLLKLKNKKHEFLFIGAGITGIGCYYLFENVALVYSTATAVGVIVASAPLFTALLQALHGDRSSLSLRFFVGFTLAMIGLALVGVSSEGATGHQEVSVESALLGDILALLAAAVWAVYSVLVEKIAQAGYETIASTKRTFAWGLLIVVPITLVFGGGLPSSAVITSVINLGNFIFLGVVASALCFVTWGVSVKRLGPVVSTTYIYLVPAITATASILILGEPLNAGVVGGLGLTVFGLFLSQQKTSERKNSKLKA
jgi:drug/metabolite transporter (DMT)-like permease